MIKGEHLTFGGEFLNGDREAQFRTDRLAETIRHARLLFILSATLNALFLFSDWRFYGTDHFIVAIVARLSVIAVSVFCAGMVRGVVSIRQMPPILLVWETVTAIGVAFLVSSGSDLALFVALLLPTVFYLVVPTSFRLTLIMGAAGSFAMLVGYFGPRPLSSTGPGLILAQVMLNFALALVVIQSNRLQRMQWAAIQSERRAKEDLATSEAMIERIFMTTPIPLVVTAFPGGRVMRANAAASRYIGPRVNAEYMPSIIDMFTDPDSQPELARRLMEHGRVDNFEAEIRHADGSLRDILITSSILQTEPASAVVSSVIDITERKAVERRAQHDALHDALTGLPNRSLFQTCLNAMLDNTEDDAPAVALFLIDLDDFKAVNDTLGHDAGDALLVHASRCITETAGPERLVARLGGDEFAVLCPGIADADMATMAASRLLESLRKPVAHKGQSISSRASVGIALAPLHDRSAPELMKNADLALYKAKESGRNIAMLYDPAMRKTMLARVAVCNDVRGAIAHGQIVPFYQPQVSLETGKVIGFEALARWLHPTRGVVSAGAFMQAFDEPDIASAIGDVMLRQVAADIRQWIDAGLDCGRVSVNLATGMFRNRQLAAHVLSILDAAGVSTRNLSLELTETVLLNRGGNDLERTLNELRAAGISLALDDFGTGYASLTHLKRYPVDVIKIDQSFVRDLEVDPDDAAIVRALLDLGRNLELEVVAEGVETAGQEQFLRDHACTYVQGYRYAKPIAASRVPWLLSRTTLVPKAEPEPQAARDISAA
ncbi:MAG: EAL domain-containing protein [Hyphomicrobiaceae bacterium]|nr:EAL domain-containing protein [Hyphomicrobiaceae bacterium]